MKRLLLVLLLVSSASAKPWKVGPLYLPSTIDSISYRLYRDAVPTLQAGSVVGSTFDRTFSVDSGFLWQLVLSIYYIGADSVAGYSEMLDLRTDYFETEQFTLLGAEWPARTDSVKFRQYRDSTLIAQATTPRVGAQSYDTLFTVYAGDINTIILDLYYAGLANALSWPWILDMTDTTSRLSSGPAPGVYSVRVTVSVKSSAGVPVEGVKVSAYLTRSNLTDSSGATYTNAIQSQFTDNQGRAYFDCVCSYYLIPATKWRFSLHPGWSSISEYLPCQSSYNISFIRN